MWLIWLDASGKPRRPARIKWHAGTGIYRPFTNGISAHAGSMIINFVIF